MAKRKADAMLEEREIVKLILEKKANYPVQHSIVLTCLKWTKILTSQHIDLWIAE